ncbi:MAG: 30S ribosome-binding factor RbfA [Lachnospirales bacterium]
MAKKQNNRLIRINDEIMREVAIIIRGELKDPRIGVITSVTEVDTTNDLKYCKIYISVLGNDKEKEDVITGLKNAKGFIRRELARRINLRNTPELTFLLDQSLEYSMHIDELINKVTKSESV